MEDERWERTGGPEKTDSGGRDGSGDRGVNEPWIGGVRMTSIVSTSGVT